MIQEFDPDDLNIYALEGAWFKLIETEFVEFVDWLTPMCAATVQEFRGYIGTEIYESDYRHAVGFRDGITGAIVAKAEVTGYLPDRLDIELRWHIRNVAMAQHISTQMQDSFGERLVEVTSTAAQRAQEQSIEDDPFAPSDTQIEKKPDSRGTSLIYRGNIFRNDT